MQERKGEEKVWISGDREDRREGVRKRVESGVIGVQVRIGKQGHEAGEKSGCVEESEV